MATSTLPKRPVENWEGVRDEWVAALDRLVKETRAWAEARGWGVLEEEKQIEEDRLGAYRVPRILIHDLFGRILLDPVARFAPGVSGVVDLYKLPSWDGLMLVRTDEGWSLLKDDAEGARLPWTAETLDWAVEALNQPR